MVGHHQGQASANELWRERVAEKHGVKQGLKCVMVLSEGGEERNISAALGNKVPQQLQVRRLDYIF